MLCGEARYGTIVGVGSKQHPVVGETLSLFIKGELKGGLEASQNCLLEISVVLGCVEIVLYD